MALIQPKVDKDIERYIKDRKIDCYKKKISTNSSYTTKGR